MSKGFSQAQSRYDRQLPDYSDGPEGDCPTKGCENRTSNYWTSSSETGIEYTFEPCDDCKPCNECEEKLSECKCDTEEV